MGVNKMVTPWGYVVLAAFTSIMYGQDITIPIEGGNIVIRPQFIRVNQYNSYIPELSFQLKNETSYPWNTIKLQFEIGGFCNGEPRTWSIPAVTSLGYLDDHPIVKSYVDTVIPLVGKVDGCRAEVITAHLVLAENSKFKIGGLTGEKVDLERQLQELKAKRDVEAAAQAEEERRAEALQAEEERRAAAEEAKKDAAEVQRQKRLAAEHKKREAEEDARLAKVKAAEEAKAADERRRVRAACSAIYQNTADKKMKDLTVREDQQVRTCQALGLYPP
jgi:hypothetical protein